MFMEFRKYTQAERTNILSPYIQDKLKSAKLNLIINLGFPQNLIDSMIPYIADEAPAWQLRMISFFDADPEDLRLTLEGAIKEESIGDFQEIRKKYYSEHVESKNESLILKSMEQNGSFIKLQYELIQQINSQLQQQLLSQDQRADLLAEKEALTVQLHDSQKEVVQLQQRLDDVVESFHTKESAYLEQIRLLQNRIEDLQNPKQIEVFMPSAESVESESDVPSDSDSTSVQENSDFQIDVQAERHSWFSFLRKNKKSKTEKLAEQEQQARDQLIKSYIYDPEHSEHQTELLLAADTSEEWTLEDLKTLASQPDLEKMQSLQHKMEQLYHVQK